jgi:hypothetical protein
VSGGGVGSVSGDIDGGDTFIEILEAEVTNNIIASYDGGEL